MAKFLLLTCILLLSAKPIICGIEVPRENCQWISGDYGQTSQCDGNQVVVGACGAGRYADCPGDTWHQILCCAMPDFVYGECQKYGSGHGQLNSCLEHGNVARLLEGTCGSGAELDCDGYSVINNCCIGHLFSGEQVGPNKNQCTWEYADYGYQLECGRSDEVVAGRCGSGQINRCPNGSSHGILCCEFTQSEEHTSELQSHHELVCRLLL